MIMGKVLEEARPYLEGKHLSDLVIGLSMIGCRLSDGTVGVVYLLRDALPNGCSVFEYALSAEGKPAAEIASWVLTGADDVQRGIGAAILNAASRNLSIPDDDSPLPFGMEIRAGDVVGMVGYIRPVAQRLKTLASEVIVFDRGVELAGGNEMVQPCMLQKELLPRCDLVILSGTTTINGTIDELLNLCGNAREVVLVGTSTPMFAKGFAGTNVTHLAGSWWDGGNWEQIRKVISLAGGVRALSAYSTMKNQPVFLDCPGN